MNGPKIDVRHQRIIDEVMKINDKKEVMVVGAGDCKIDYHLIKNGWTTYSTDYEKTAQEYSEFNERMKAYSDILNYNTANIFDVNTFPVEESESVVCSEVLEHLCDYETAFKNLLALTSKRLIITVPWRRSFDDTVPPPKGHCNYWDDKDNGIFKSIENLTDLAKPHKVHIEKIITKDADVPRNQRCYLIIIDK